MRVLIIEDERKAANELSQLVLGLRPDWRIVDMLPSVHDAIEWFRENKEPDLVFSDIQLADGDCFKIFSAVKPQCPVVFCTAYDEYAVKAFETNSIDYLLKPVDKVKLERALVKLDKVRSMFKAGMEDSFGDLGKLISQMNVSSNKSILVHHQDKIIPVKYADVAFFHYNQGVIMIRTISNTTYHVSMTIEEIEAGADPKQFYRANRQFLVNRNAIQSIEKFFARKLVVKLNVNTPEILIVSKAKAGDFLNWLEGSI
jgi:DNA-binding LytR/AlgR family response regulator